MPAEGALPQQGDQNFGLIETFRWSPQEGYAYLDEHLVRLKSSAIALGFLFDQLAVEHRLDEFVDTTGLKEARVRLVLHASGAMEVTGSSLSQTAQTYHVAIAETRHRSNDRALLHKTTLRDRYEMPLAAAQTTFAVDEVLFLNERDEICEGARANVFVRRSGELLTPPLSSGLLPGTFRHHLIRQGRVREAVLRLSDIYSAPEWYMGNSVRGLVRAQLAAADVELIPE